jgi:hypothetical protein
MRRRLVIVLALAAAAPAALTAQSAPRSTAAVAGVVLDASTGGPLAGAFVTLEPATSGLIVTASGGLLAVARVVETGGAGEYRFDDVVPGRYRLRIERIGFRPVSIEAEVRRPMDARISVGLEIEPVPLEPLTVREPSAPLFRRASARPDEPEEARLLLERERQQLFLTPDSRALSYADVIEGVTLGETDVFRALQRFPGIATRDDYTAELWTRGAPWAETRVTFDGLPLFNPVHAVGIFSAVMPEILGAVFLHPGVRSPALAEGAAGAVDLRSRPGGGNGELRGAADVSMASARLAFDQRIGERAAWVLSARRSYLEVLTGGPDWLGLDRLELPYSFHDLAGRLDLGLGRRSALEASGLWEEDRLFGDVEGVLAGTTARWGNAAGRVTLRNASGEWSVRHTIGLSRYRSRVQDAADGLDTGPAPWVEPAGLNRVTHVRLGGELERRTDGAAVPGLVAGYDVVVQSTSYDGPLPRFHPVRPDTLARLERAGRLWTAGAWTEARWQAGKHVELSPGARIEVGSPVSNAPALRIAPRVAARFSISPDHSLSLAVGRSWQYLQAIGLAGPSAHPAFHASQFWLLADTAAPAIRSDIVTLGSEHWLGRGWLLSLSGYRRQARGVALPDPKPGPLVRRPLFVEGVNRARGFEAGLRRVTGRVTTALGYTLAASDIEAAGYEFPAATDRRHRVDATLAARLPGGLRAGLAYAGMSGAPYTRVLARIRNPDCSFFGFACNTQNAHVAEPNALRGPDYHGLDALLSLTRTFGPAQFTAYLQVRNVTAAANASAYSGSVYEVFTARDGSRHIVWEDRFEAGLPRLPLIGARVTF